jgi:hypothetical protein
MDEPHDDEPTSVGRIKIAPGVTVDDWNSLTLKNSNKNKDAWQRAADIVRSRLEQRYFEPCQLLINADNRAIESGEQPTFGFAIMAICCLLVETLESFAGGETSTINRSELLAIKFLTGTDSFKHDFDEEAARRYYTDFRCGILHVGETGGLSLVRACGPLLKKTAAGLVINRTEFFSGLRTELDTYIRSLNDATLGRHRTTLRNNLKTKMDFICRTHLEST